MSKFKSSVAVYKDFISLMKSNFDDLIFAKFFERISHSFPIDEDELIDEREISNFYFKTNQRVNFLYDLALTYSVKYLTDEELIIFEFRLAEILKLYRKNELALKILKKIIENSHKDSIDKKLLADCYLYLAEIYSNEAMWKEFEREIKNASCIYEELNDNSGLAECQFMYGSTYLEKGEIDAAKIRFENVERYLKTLSNPILKARLSNNLGILNIIAGKYSEANLKLIEAINTFEENDLFPFLSEAKLNLGISALKQGDLNKAVTHFDDAKILAIRSLSIQTVALSFMYKAHVYLTSGEFKKARKIIEQALSISYHINDNLTVADLFKMNGMVAKYLNQYDVAEDMLLTSLRINQELENHLNYAETSIELALLYKKLKQFPNAIFHAQNALNYYEKIDSEDVVKEINLLVNSIKYLQKD